MSSESQNMKKVREKTFFFTYLDIFKVWTTFTFSASRFCSVVNKKYYDILLHNKDSGLKAQLLA